MNKKQEQKNEDKLFVFDVPATFTYEIYAKNKTEAKKILIEEGGYTIDGELNFSDDAYEDAEPIEFED